MEIIEYNEKYLENVKDLLVELENYILEIDKDHLDNLHPDYRDKMAIYDLKDVSENNGKCFLAINDGNVIGLIMGYIRKYDDVDYLDYKCPKSGIVSELIVSKNVRNSGVGKMLLEKLEDYFKSLNCTHIFIDVFAYNKNAIKFYEKFGYHARMHNYLKKMESDNYKCLIANKDLIVQKWDEEIKRHNDSFIWKEFKKKSLNNMNTRIVYMGLLDNKIITECTAIISNEDKDIQNKDNLIGDKKAYLCAFRTNKEYEHLGYFKRLYTFMEKDLKQRGFKYLTLGVEPNEVRNIQIYFKLGFTNYIKTDYEYYPNGEKVLINYYEKRL